MLDCGALRQDVVSRARAAVPNLQWLALFGSVARGDATDESDVDVAILAPEPLPTVALRCLRTALELATSRDVHLIDLAMHEVRVRPLGVPQSGRHAFAMLAQAGVLEPALSEELQRMVGFGNVAAHRYRDLDLEVVHAIVNEESPTFEAFTSALLRHDRP